MYNDLSHYLLMISIFSVFIIKYYSITQRWIISFYFIISSLSFYAVLVGYIDSDFSVYNIFTNSNANTPLFYKISATWSNHEGSLLLWCWLLTLYGFVFCYSLTLFESTRREHSLGKDHGLYLTATKERQNQNSQLKVKPFPFALKNTQRKKETDLFVVPSFGAFLLRNTTTNTKLYVTNTVQCNTIQHDTTTTQLRPSAFLCPLLFISNEHNKCSNSVFSNTEKHNRKEQTKPTTSVNSMNTKAEEEIQTQQKRNHNTETVRSLARTHGALYSHPLLKSPFDSLIQGARCISKGPQKYTEIDHLFSFRRLQAFSKTFSTQKKLHKCDLQNTYNINTAFPNCCFGMYSNLNRFNTSWISFCVSKLNQWESMRQRTQPFVIYVSIILWFTAFLLMTSNPFLKTPFLCINSVAELNPVLQDPILAIHPPCIYAGYVASAIGFSIALSYLSQPIVKTPVFLENTSAFKRDHNTAVRLWDAFNAFRVTQKLKQTLKHKHKHSAEIQRRGLHLEVFPFGYFPLATVKRGAIISYLKENKCLLTEFTKQTRFWMLTCWCFLTIGILLGSWWAYHELGWGGWWFWDPVENASLMPWLLATASIHSILAPKLQSWTLLLSIVTFMLSILGTFFVRSGLLASVHSFATDSTRGLFILCFLLCVLFISITCFLKWIFNNQLKSHNHIQLYVEKGRNIVTEHTAVHKYKKQIEQILQIQNVILCIICLVVLCGTAAPILFQWLFHRDVSTGASFFNATTIPLFLCLLIVMIYVHYVQLHYFSKSKKIALWEHNKIQQVSPELTTGPAVCSLSIKTRSRRWFLISRLYLSLSVAIQSTLSLTLSFLRFFVKYNVNTLHNHSMLFYSVFIFLSHALILYHLTDFSYLESILVALCVVLCCYIIMSSTHRTRVLFLVTETPFLNTQQTESNVRSIGVFKTQNPLYNTELFVNNKEKNQNAILEMTHKERCALYLTVASRLITLTDKNPLRRTAFSMRLSHIGVLIFIIGVIVSNRKKIQLVQIMRFGQQVQLDNGICCLRSIDQNYGPTYHSICGNIIIQQQISTHFNSVFIGPLGNYLPHRAVVDLNDPGVFQLKHSARLRFSPHICMFPEKRFFFSNPTLSATKVAIHTNLFTDFYALIGTGSAETGWYTTIMQLPFLFCIWIGFLLTACGGLYSLRLFIKTSDLKWQ